MEGPGVVDVDPPGVCRLATRCRSCAASGRDGQENASFVVETTLPPGGQQPGRHRIRLPVPFFASRFLGCGTHPRGS